MSESILALSYPSGKSDEQIVSLVASIVGTQLTADQYRQVCEHLTGEDYTIAERFWPALRHLYDIIETQEDEHRRADMTVTLATTTRYAVWQMFSPQTFDPEIRGAAEDCCRLFLETSFSISDVNDKRHLLMGVAAAMGDSEAAKHLHDIGSGYKLKHAN